MNKTASKATLRWDPFASRALPADVRERFARAYANRLTGEGELVLHGQRYRDQARNAADCVAKLAEMLRAVARPKRARRPTRPSRGSVERRLGEKKRRSEAKRERRGPSVRSSEGQRGPPRARSQAQRAASRRRA